MKYLSVCSGIEAATVAWHPLGWEPVAFSEIEKFPCELLKHHYPNILNYGDMTKYKEWPDAKIDVLVGGTPCQSFSVAGLRKGLDDPRGNLMLTYLGVADKYKPRWIVWENVPGVLSSGRGRDFGSFLGALGELGYGWAYRVLDAQYFGVPQRRRRVFVVGCLGDQRRAASVLFEPDCLRRDFEKSRKARKGASRIAGTLAANGGGTTRPAGNCNELDFCVPIAIQDIRGMDKAQNGKGWNDEGKSYTLDATATQGVVAFTTEQTPKYDYDQCLTLTKQSPTGGGQIQSVGYVTGGATPATLAVRRLLPVECERLQGFPADYTKLSDKTPDGHRYKALGNSMAVPVMQWIGKRIQIAED